MPRLAVWWRAIFPRRLVRSKSGRADIAYLFFGLFGYGLAFGWIAFSTVPVASATAHLLTLSFGPPRITPATGPIEDGILTVIIFLAYEFAYWFDHYLSHRLPLLWQFHRTHHAAESLSLLTNFRVHPVDTIVFAGITAAVLGFTQGIAGYAMGTGAHAWELGGTNILVLGTAILLTHLQHSHFWVTFGPRWGKWLLSPAHHQIHHSEDSRHYDRNFGSTLAVWDRLFGTLHLPTAKRESLRFGLGAAEPRPHGLRFALVTPFVGAIGLFGRKPVPRPADLDAAIPTSR